MPALRISFQFLVPQFHGRSDHGHEWPPSPLRAFQALLAAAAAADRARLSDRAVNALSWLEQLDPPLIVAPARHAGHPIRMAVPNNDLDLVAGAWAKGVTPAKDARELKTMKTLAPVHLRAGDTVHFLWRLGRDQEDALQTHVETIAVMARTVVALGLGMNIVVGGASRMDENEVAALEGVRWTPVRQSETDGLPVPTDGTLAALRTRHRQFLDRLSLGSLAIPRRIGTTRRFVYRHDAASPLRTVAAFSLLHLDGRSFRAFDTVRRALTVAGMMRHATAQATRQAGWPAERVAAFVLGHGSEHGSADPAPVGPRRFAFLPVPSLQFKGDERPLVAGAIRRVLVTSFAEDCEQDVAWVRRALSGQEVIDEHTQKPIAVLSLIPQSDTGVRRYLSAATTWSTVIPVVLPGYDDPKHLRRRLAAGVDADEQHKILRALYERTDALIRKAIVHAGFSEELARWAEIDWRTSGFWPGTDLAGRYGVPDHLKRFPRLHVRIEWRDRNRQPLRIPGPICLGAGRFYGIGLFAAEP